MKFNRSIFIETSASFFAGRKSLHDDMIRKCKAVEKYSDEVDENGEKKKQKKKWTRDERRKAMAMNAQPYNLTFWHFLYPRHYLNMNKYSSDTKFSLNKKRNYCYLFFVATTT